MITIKTPAEIEIMKKGGNISKNALNIALEMAQEGVSLADIDKAVDNFIVANKAFHSFKKVPVYHHATCININDGLVHGIPNKYLIK